MPVAAMRKPVGTTMAALSDGGENGSGFQHAVALQGQIGFFLFPKVGKEVIAIGAIESSGEGDSLSHHIRCCWKRQ